MGFPDINTIQGRATTNGADQQIATAPWKMRRRYIPLKMIATNESTSASLVKMYDNDTTTGAPPTRGNNTINPLYEFYIPPQATIIFEKDSIPIEFFHAAITVNCTQTPVQFTIELKDD